MEGGNTRQTNIELLRILCMLFILLFHCNLNVILRNNDTSDGLNYCALFVNSLVVVAVNVFVLISGYFSIKIKLKSIAGLLFQTEFFAVVAILIYGILTMMGQNTPVRLTTIVLGLFPFQPSGLWFIPCYALLLFVSPVLNWICKVKKAHAVTLITLLGGV